MIYALALTGPTASGKTALSIELAKQIGAEIISCDSMQIYREMNIGTAKATREERSAVKHHLIDFVSPLEDYSIEIYRKSAIEAAENISRQGKIPLFAGGTGLYIDALARAPQSDVPESSREYREETERGIKNDEDIHRLWQKLYEIDPESAEKIHERNVRRVIRAIEIFETTGKTKSYFDRLSREAERDISVDMITLDFHNRENLYKRIDSRVCDMMSAGLACEVKDLYQRGLLKDGTTAAQAIGYKEIISAIRGECTLSEAAEQIKLSSRRYAKRQLTWFRHNRDAERVYLDTEEGIMREFKCVLDEILEISKKYIEGFENEGKRT